MFKHCTGGSDKNHSLGKETPNGKMAEEVMQRAEKRRDMKDKAKRKDIPI